MNPTSQTVLCNHVECMIVRRPPPHLVSKRFKTSNRMTPAPPKNHLPPYPLPHGAPNCIYARTLPFSLVHGEEEWDRIGWKVVCAASKESRSGPTSPHARPVVPDEGREKQKKDPFCAVWGQSTGREICRYKQGISDIY